MKSLIANLITTAIILTTIIQIKSQTHQIPNSDFELWDGTSNTAEPTNWNSFPSANCALSGLAALGCSSAKSAHHYKVSGKRPGGTGSYYVTVWSKSILGVVANGNITLGQIHIGSTTATASSNYNLTVRGSNDFNTPLTATPDSLYVWVKFWASNASSKARVSAILHGNNDFKDPNDLNDTTLFTAIAEDEFLRTGTTAGNCTWIQRKIPFRYSGSATPQYILLSMTNNATPGGGNAGDSLSIDDIELIYSAWLTDIKVNNTTISGFHTATFDYDYVLPRGSNPNLFPTVTYTSEVSDVWDTLLTYSGVNGGVDSAYSVITVTAEDGVTQKIYRINYSIWKSSDSTLSNIGYTMTGNDTVLIAGFSPTQQVYNVSFPSGTTDIPFINYVTFSDTGAKLLQITQATSPNGQATIKVRAENGNIATYIVNFSVQKSSNAKLDSLLCNGVYLSEFHPDTLSYSIILTPGTTIPPLVSAKTQWYGLVPTITQATSLPSMATVLVTAEDGITQQTYTLHFMVALSTNDSANWIKYNGVNIPNFHPDTLQYDVILPYGTSNLNLTASPVWATANVNITHPVSLPGVATVHIIAEDTNHKRTYAVNFSIAKNDNALLDSVFYQIDGFSHILQDLADTVYFYTIALAPKTTHIPVLSAQAQDSNAHISIQQATSLSDTVIINVLAEDSIHAKNYYFVFHVKLDTNAYLSSLKVNDSLISGFDSFTLTYNVFLDSAVIPMFTAITVDTAARYQLTYPHSLPGIVSINVKAEDTTVNKEYRVYLSIKSADNADLLDLGYSLNNVPYAISEFHKDSLNYHVLLPSQTTDIPVLTFQKAVSGSTVMIQQPTSPKDTGIIVVKSANDSVQKIYYLFFDVEISTNATLKSISLNANNITSFHADTVYYHVYLHYDSLTPPVVGAMTQSAAASMLISQATTVNDSAVISVTAEDSLYKRTYIVHFTRQLSPVATLNSMGYKLDNKDSSLREFNSNVFSYTVHLKAETTHIPHTFTYVKTDARASVQIMRMPLHVNDTAVLKVVAENLTDSNVYEIVFKRIPSNNTYLDTLFINGNSIADFYKDSLHYIVILPWSTTQIPTINAVASWNLSTINITQATSYFGLAQIRVVSEDGLHSRTYTVQFEQGSQVDLQSLSYGLDTQTIAISTFHPADTVYYVQLPIGTKSIPTLHYTLVDNRCYVDTIPALSPNGEIELIVKGWDKLNLKTYKVVFEVLLSTNANLSDLTIDNVTVYGFHPDTLIYYSEYPYGTTDLPIVGAVAVEPDASVSVTQITTYPDVAHVIVKAGDTTVSKIYQIYFSTEAGDNAYLAAMYVDDTLINDFDKNILFYKHELPYGTTTVPVIYAEAEDARAHVEITQAHSFQDTVWVKVTAVNGVNTTTYGLVFRIALNNDARLVWIKVDNTPIATFNPETNNYKYELPFGYQGVPTVTVEKQDKNATTTITPTTTIPGQTVIDVIAEDGETVRTYRVNFVIANAIYETQENCQFLVYPNPAHDLVSVENKGGNKHINLIQLYDVFGKLIKQSKVNQSITHIDIKELPNGMYILKIIQHDQTSSNVKIIKY